MESEARPVSLTIGIFPPKTLLNGYQGLHVDPNNCHYIAGKDLQFESYILTCLLADGLKRQ